MSKPAAHTAARRYSTLKPLRAPYETRARQVALLTVPMYSPDDLLNENANIPVTETSFPARCISHLSSKTLMALFPTDRPSFRLDMDAKLKLQAEEAAKETPGLDITTSINTGLAGRELATQQEMERSNLRVTLLEALNRLLVTGNGVIHLTDNLTFRFYALNRFVCVRDGDGTLVELILLDSFHPATISKEVEKVLKSDGKDADAIKKMKSIDVYTYCTLESGKWSVYQEVNGKRIEEGAGTYDLDEFPYWALRDIAHDGEHYGRSRGELYIGDFTTLQNMTRSFVDGAAIATRILFGISLESTITPEQLAAVPNGGFLKFNKDHVFAVQGTVNVAALQVAENTSQNIEQRLSMAFLLNSSVRRDAERVTATEINVLASEIEEVQTGLFSGLANSFQNPLITCFIRKMENLEKLLKLDKDATAPSILTGLSALGRSADLQRLMTFLQLVGSLPGVAQRLKYNNVLARVAQSVGLTNPQEIIKTEEEYQESIQTDMAQQAAAQGMAAGAGALGASAGQQVAEGGLEGQM